MKRQIIFRGKCDPQSKFAGQWVHGGCVQCENGVTLIYSAQSDTCTLLCHVIGDTVGQFTGLQDIKGKDIYEGDIVRMKTITGGTYFIAYEDSHIGAFSLCNPNGHFAGIFGRDADFEPFYCEVIGNIHDNPEFLKIEN